MRFAWVSAVAAAVLLASCGRGGDAAPSGEEALKAAQPRAELTIWDGVNHVLKVAPAERAANIATYMDPALPLAPGVVEAVADFMLK